MSGDAALLIDFGSTYTKVRAVDMDGGDIIGSAQGPSTVTSDVSDGLARALDILGERMGGLPRFACRLASSSAAGGLRMVTVGLVRELTAEAARQAALGAGAKLVGTFAYRLTAGDVNAITALAPDILLLAGGTDGGNDEVILHNARRLADSSLACPVVVAGNRQAADAIAAMLEDAGKTVSPCDNVMPEFGVLNTEPARAAIRRIFIDRIIHAKGIDKAAAMFDAVLMPTPAAVMDGAQLLADGHGGRPGLGDLIVVDIGGATTDVHSVTDGDPAGENVIVQGLPEPYVKRTVEGDLGVRHNARSIAEAAGPDMLAANAGLSRERLDEFTERAADDPEWLPDDGDGLSFDRELARAAAGLAVKRHAGTLDTVYATTGPVTVQRGKDLSAVGTVIGTGGPVVHAGNPGAILNATLASGAEPFSLRPKAPKLLLDRDYVLYACGLLRTVAPEAALTMGLRHMHPVGGKGDDGRTSAA